MLFKLFFYLILTLLIWQGLNVTYIYLKRQFLLLSNEVVDNNGSIWEQCLLLSGNQVGILKNLIQELIFWQLNKTIEKQLQARKSTVLQNVVNHLNQNLYQDLQLKTVNPATTGGVDIWVYLANNLNDDEQLSLENYFVGVITLYTNEFALDVLTVELTAGSGWVAKFDVKTIQEATYNRMTRQTKVSYEEDF
ncbi:hypothetical protein [Streptococcus infantis]|jgi:hypothetical protein|uniref:hypothetical protein n=1 Tax=Streptococcus infantis TaxID=68892 RepID=UPI0039C35352